MTIVIYCKPWILDKRIKSDLGPTPTSSPLSLLACIDNNSRKAREINFLEYFLFPKIY